jgi:hypothetical protein
MFLSQNTFSWRQDRDLNYASPCFNKNGEFQYCFQWAIVTMKFKKCSHIWKQFHRGLYLMRYCNKIWVFWLLYNSVQVYIKDTDHNKNYSISPLISNIVLNIYSES